MPRSTCASVHLTPGGGFTIGHEAIGEVVEVGSEVRRFCSGDRVLVSGVVAVASAGPAAAAG